MAKSVYVIDPLTVRPTPEIKIRRARERIKSFEKWKAELESEMKKVQQLIDDQKKIIKENGGSLD